MAIERLDADNALRTETTFDGLLQAYAGTYGQLEDMETCAAAHHICSRRFWDFSTNFLLPA
ncbi:hypothetical protein GCM10022212_02640 [Actimicrobium antarcticum]|uniref:Uncharacterized protein n=1 Tax=Actimicrobium antarcticum TaxID=1051899 RepID=A0ABP7SJB5_9BURK